MKVKNNLCLQTCIYSVHASNFCCFVQTNKTADNWTLIFPHDYNNRSFKILDFFPLTRVLFGRGLVSTLEEFDGGVTAHPELLRQLCLLRGVHFAQSDVRTLAFQNPCCFGVFGSKSFAVTAPRGIWNNYEKINMSKDSVNSSLVIQSWFKGGPGEQSGHRDDKFSCPIALIKYKAVTRSINNKNHIINDTKLFVSVLKIRTEWSWKNK